MSVLLSPGVAGCPSNASPPSGYTTLWRVDPTTGAWWLPKVRLYTAGGSVVSNITGIVPVNTLTVPDQGVAGQLQVSCSLKLASSVPGDQFEIIIDNVVSQVTVGIIETTTHGSNSISLIGVVAMPAGAAMTVRTTVSRLSGTGVGATAAGALTNALHALFVPN